MKKQNSNRLEEFRQLKSDIRGSKKHLIVGIDVAKNKHHAFFGTATGRTLYRRLVFDNNINGFEELFLRTKATMVAEGLSKVVFGLEPTANYHKPLGDFLVKRDYTVVLVSANAVKKNRELLDGRWDKNDTKDASNVADLVSQGKCLYYDYPSMEIRNLRTLLSLKRKLKKQEHSLRMRIRNHLIAQYFPEMDRYQGKCERENLAIVNWCLDPVAVADMDFADFLQTVTTRDRGAGQRQRLRNIWQEASRSVGCEFGAAAAFEAKTLVASLKQVRQAIAEADSKIEGICRQCPEYEYVLSIPGFGPVVAGMTVGALGDPYRFHSGKQVLKMAGLDLSASRSGKNSENIIPVISKKGKAELRYGLYQAALIASFRNKHFIRYFTDKLQGRERERGIKTKMRVKLAAKMLIIAWSLMKKKEFFDPSCLHDNSAEKAGG